jgi:chromate transporter
VAVAGAGALLLVPSAVTQVGVIVAGAGLGLALCRDGASGGAVPLGIAVGRGPAVAALVAFGVLLVGLPLMAGAGGLPGLAEAGYRAGALVFGGGHVVLPLLERSFVPSGWVEADTFLAGYAVAQAVPGPLFTFGAFLGAAAGGVAGGVVVLVAIFLPGLLLMYGALPFWDGLRRIPSAQAALRGVNAAVVGILLAALFDPIWLSTVRVPADFAIALAAFAALVWWKVPVWLVVAATAAAGAVAHLA